MKSKKKSTLMTDVIGILCGVFLVAVGVASAVSTASAHVAGMRDSQIPDSALTMIGTAEGRNGVIKVQVKGDEGQIYQIKVLSEDETKGIGSVAVKEVPRAICANQDLQVDGATGATITSDGIKAAVYDALTQNGIDAYHFGYRIVKADKVAKRAETGAKSVVAVTPEQWKAEHPKVYSAYWKDEYPDIYASFLQNEQNKDVIEYTEEFPQIVSLYAGYPFSYDYASARGHAYVIDDVTGTDRLHKKMEDGSLNPEIFQKANCFTCKSPVMAALVNETGGEAYSWTFEQMQAFADEPVGCYTCHGDTPGEFTVTHTYLADGVGDDFERIDAANLACGQCHNEYFFMPGTNSTTLPHDSLASMSPDLILDYYNTQLKKTEADGTQAPFYDFSNKISGVKVIKVQHPELETYLGEGSQHRGKFTCADCHMGDLKTADGKTTKNHYLTSPLDNEDLLKNTCSECHTDLKAEVQAIQDAVVKRTVKIADQLVTLHQKIGEAAASGKYSDSELAEMRSLARDAQFYWDFVFVENSNGAHNSKLTNECLDKAASLTEQALGMFK